MGGIISLGKCEKIFFFISLAYYLIFIFSSFIEDKIFEEDQPNEYTLLKSTFKYIGQIFFILGHILYKKESASEKESNNNLNIKSDTIKSNMTTNLNLVVKHRLTFINYVFIGLVGLLLIIVDFFQMFQYALSKGNVFMQGWTFELYFIIFITVFYLKAKLYRHQYLAIIFFTINCLLWFIIQINKFDRNKYLSILFQIVSGFLESIIIMFTKFLMEYKYFSPFKVCYIYGIICSGIMIILIFILSSIKCKTILCQVNYRNSKYFFNIYKILNQYNSYQIIYLFSYILFGSIKQLLINIIINKYTICHIFLFIKFNSVCSNFFHAQVDDGIIQSILTPVSIILENLMFFIFLEIIELNFCGLSDNLVRKIQDRSDDDSSNNSMDLDNSKFELFGGYVTSLTNPNDTFS